jgi:hypothetical protein
LDLTYFMPNFHLLISRAAAVFTRGLAGTVLGLLLMSQLTYAAAELDAPMSVVNAGCLGIDGIAVGTSGLCTVAAVISEDINGADDIVTSISLTGDSEFTIGSSSTCAVGARAPSSPGCSIAINFTPTSGGTKSATLHVTTSYSFVKPAAISTLSLPIIGQSLATVIACSQSETPTCMRSDGTVAPNSSCTGAALPASQSCTSGSCAACTTGLGASRFIYLQRQCDGKGGCAGFHPFYGITDAQNNSCGTCSTWAPAKSACPAVTAATSCGSSYVVAKRVCTFYDVNGTESTSTFNAKETLATNCVYTLANDAGGATCGSCEATWITPSGGTNPIGTTTGNNTCPFTAY